MAILRGRVLAEADQIGGPAAAVVNQALAAQLWTDRDAIGGELSVDGPGGPLVQVVGVARMRACRRTFGLPCTCQADRRTIVALLAWVDGENPRRVCARSNARCGPWMAVSLSFAPTF